MMQHPGHRERERGKFSLKASHEKCANSKRHKAQNTSHISCWEENAPLLLKRRFACRGMFAACILEYHRSAEYMTQPQTNKNRPITDKIQQTQGNGLKIIH